MMTQTPHRCLAPGCPAHAPFGFVWGVQKRWACGEHREAGQAWLARVKGEGHAR